MEYDDTKQSIYTCSQHIVLHNKFDILNPTRYYKNQKIIISIKFYIFKITVMFLKEYKEQQLHTFAVVLLCTHYQYRFLVHIIIIIIII